MLHMQFLHLSAVLAGAAIVLIIEANLLFAFLLFAGVIQSWHNSSRERRHLKRARKHAEADKGNPQYRAFVKRESNHPDYAATYLPRKGSATPDALVHRYYRFVSGLGHQIDLGNTVEVSLFNYGTPNKGGSGTWGTQWTTMLVLRDIEGKQTNMQLDRNIFSGVQDTRFSPTVTAKVCEISS